MVALAALAHVLGADLAVVAMIVLAATAGDLPMGTFAADALIRRAGFIVLAVALALTGVDHVMAATIEHAAVDGHCAGIGTIQGRIAAVWIGAERLLVDQILALAGDAGVQGAGVGVVAILQAPAWTGLR